MPAIITSKFRFHNAEQFKESFSEAAPSNYYLFIGRSGEFKDGAGGGTDSAPPTPVDNRTSESNHWDAMLAAKKIASTGVAHAIPRRDLDTSGNTIYDMYRPDYSTTKPAKSGATNLFDSTFYFMTSAYRVYKVLNNGSSVSSTGVAFSGGAEPTGFGKDPFEFGGYTIKYMFTLSTQDVQNFLTPDFIPVPSAAESGNALTNGSIDMILISDAGTFSGTVAFNADRVVNNVPIRGDGYGGTCSVTIGGASGSNDGQVTAVTVSTTGEKYTHASVTSADIIEQYGLQYAGQSDNPTLAFTADVPQFEVIIGPDGGHGSNPAKELGGHFIMMDTKLQTTEGFDFSVVNDFRQVGIVRDPAVYGSPGSAFTSSTARQTYAIKIAAGNVGTFGVDTKISQDIPAQTISTIASNAAGTTFTVTTAAAHNLVTGHVVTIAGGNFTVPSPAAGNTATGHQGTHHITRLSATQFSYTVGTSRKVNGAQTLNSGVTYTTADPQGLVVEWDAGNRVLFYVRTAYTDQGLDASKQTLPFVGGGTITGTSTSGQAATGTADLAYSQTLNNTVFVAGYANPEMQPDSGDIIYVENRKPISRASDQTEDIKLIVEF